MYAHLVVRTCKPHENTKIRHIINATASTNNSLFNNNMLQLRILLMWSSMAATAGHGMKSFLAALIRQGGLEPGDHQDGPIHEFTGHRWGYFFILI